MARVVLFTRSQPECGYCTRAKAWLKHRNIDFTEHDVSTNPSQLNLMTKLAPDATTFPVVIVDGKFIGGHDQLVEMPVSALKQRQVTAKALRALAQGGVVKIVFNKVDNTVRTMFATTSFDHIPVDKIPKTSDNKGSVDEASSIVKVFDIEANGWRSVDVNRVISVAVE